MTSQKILALDASSNGCSAAIFLGDTPLAMRQLPAGHGMTSQMPAMVAALIEAVGAPALIGVVVGPGSFTGLRASLALALGLGLAGDVPVVGVTVAEVLAAAMPHLGGRTLWVALEARRGRIFLDRGDGFVAFQTDAIPAARGRVAVAGDAANLVAGTLAAREVDVMLTSARRPQSRQIAQMAERRARGALAPLETLPLYVDPPEARLPAGGLRPLPQ